MLGKFKNTLKSIFRRAPEYQPVRESVSSCQNMKMTFAEGWEQEEPRHGDSTFIFVNNKIEGVLFASVMSNSDSNYKYHPSKSLEIYKEENPELVDISKYKAVLCITEEEGSNVFYRHYDIGNNQTLARFTWMTPIPYDQTTNQAIESIFETIEIK